MMRLMTLDIDPTYVAFAFAIGILGIGKKAWDEYRQSAKFRFEAETQWKASILAILREISDRLTAIENNKDHPATPVMKELVIGLGLKVNEHTRAINTFRALMFPQEASNMERMMPPLPMDDGPGYDEREIAERVAAGVPRNRAVAEHEAAIRAFQGYAARAYSSQPTQNDDHMTMS